MDGSSSGFETDLDFTQEFSYYHPRRRSGSGVPHAAQ